MFTLQLWRQDNPGIIFQEDKKREIVEDLQDILWMIPRRSIYPFYAHSIGQNSVVQSHLTEEDSGKKNFATPQLENKTNLMNT